MLKRTKLKIMQLLLAGALINCVSIAYAMEKPEQVKASSKGISEGQIALEVADCFYFHAEGPQPQSIGFYERAANQPQDLVSAFCAADMLRFLTSDQELGPKGPIEQEEGFVQEIGILESKAIELFNQISEKQIKDIWNVRLRKILQRHSLEIENNSILDSYIHLIGENIISGLNCDLYKWTNNRKNINGLLSSSTSIRNSFIHDLVIDLKNKIYNQNLICKTFYDYINSHCTPSFIGDCNILFRFLINKQAVALIQLREEILWMIAHANFYKQIASPDIKECISCLRQLIDSCEDRKSTINNPLWAQANFLFGKIYHFGRDSILPDYSRARLHFIQATISNIPFVVPSAQIALGQLNHQGKGGAPNYTTAWGCYTAALQEEQEKNGLAVNQNARIKAWVGLAYLHYFGKDDESFKADISKAKEYFELVSQQDDIPHLRADAFRRLGDIYYYGKKEVVKDLSTAQVYYSKALDGADQERESLIRKQLARLEKKLINN